MDVTSGVSSDATATDDSSSPVLKADDILRILDIESEETSSQSHSFSDELTFAPSPGSLAELRSGEDGKGEDEVLETYCLLPGEPPLVSIQDAPLNARRIFATVDIHASFESVWKVLTDYEGLQRVVPSLVKNDVLYRTEKGGARLSQVRGCGPNLSQSVRGSCRAGWRCESIARNHLHCQDGARCDCLPGERALA